jgi:hypothetical protein
MKRSITRIVAMFLLEAFLASCAFLTYDPLQRPAVTTTTAAGVTSDASARSDAVSDTRRNPDMSTSAGDRNDYSLGQ